MKLKLILIIIIYIIISLSFNGCESNLVEPEQLNISGRYQNDDYYPYDMIMLVEHNDTHVKATLEWSGFTTVLEGTFDAKNSQVIMGGNFNGNQNISFNLIYSNYTLVGGFNYYNYGTQAIKLNLINPLKKQHDQGGVF